MKLAAVWMFVGVCFLGAMGMGACAGEAAGSSARTLRAGGPKIVYEPTGRPFPTMPFPNDVATRLDERSPTGRFLNFSEWAPTEVERRVRRRLNTLDGFGILSSINVAFDAPIDIAAFRDRHHGDKDLSNDGLILIRLGDGPACDTRHGDARFPTLDVGQGHYPLLIDAPCQFQYLPWVGDFICDPAACVGDDPRPGASNLIFEVTDEDLNKNGVLDPGEDTDFDGVLDKPNTWSGEDSIAARPDDLLTFYEKQTNTLISWPVAPLHEATRYAVVVTRAVTGLDGTPVESPFPGRIHVDQLDAWDAIGTHLGCIDLGADDIAFAWTFTTGTPSRDLIELRAGLYGAGPFSEIAAGALAGGFWPERSVDEGGGEDPDASPFVLPTDALLPILQPLAGGILETPGAGSDLVRDSQAVDYWVTGTFTSPNLMVDKQGRAIAGYPDEQDELFQLDRGTGAVRWAPSEVPFLCTIPKTTAEHKPPFPVALYGHGYSGASFEILGFAGRFAQAGIALCGVEAPSHGLVIPESEQWILDLIASLLPDLGLQSFFDNFYGGRVTDLDMDGLVGERDNGTDFWTADAFHTRDMVRQMILDHMAFFKHLRQIDGVIRTPESAGVDADGDGKPDLVGDFNGDGIPDLGGWVDANRNGKREAGEAEQHYYAWGQSLGGISTAILAALEPSLRAAAPVSAAGGLVHVATRSSNLGVPDAVILPMLGPFVTFKPAEEGTGTDIGWLAPRVNEPVRPIFHRNADIAPGDLVIIHNVATGASARAIAPASGTFRVGLGADAMRLGEKRVFLGVTANTPRPVVVTKIQAKALGDGFMITVFAGPDSTRDARKLRVNTVSAPYTFMGVRFPAGSPLVAPVEGLGYTRNSPDFRRILGIAQTAMEPADPVSFARYIREDPLDFPYEIKEVRDRRAKGVTPSVLHMHTVGDSAVPIAAGLTLSRAMGILREDDIDPETGKTPMDILRETYTAEGVEGAMRFTQRKTPTSYCPPVAEAEWSCPPVREGEEARYAAFYGAAECGADNGQCAGGCPDETVCFYDNICVPCLPACAAETEMALEGVFFDVDDLDDGTDRLILPEYNLKRPLRVTWPKSGKSETNIMALRIPYLYRYGSHGVPPSIPERAFNINGFATNQMIWFFATDGQELSDDPCLESSACPFIPWHIP